MQVSVLWKFSISSDFLFYLQNDRFMIVKYHTKLFHSNLIIHGIANHAVKELFNYIYCTLSLSSFEGLTTRVNQAITIISSFHTNFVIELAINWEKAKIKIIKIEAVASNEGEREMPHFWYKIYVFVFSFPIPIDIKLIIIWKA